jgi:hypothetical protein
LVATPMKSLARSSSLPWSSVIKTPIPAGPGLPRAPPST